MSESKIGNVEELNEPLFLFGFETRKLLSLAVIAK